MSNSNIIQMQLYEMLHETGQYGWADWRAMIAYCIGYYGVITMDHVNAIAELERTGAVKRPLEYLREHPGL